MTNLKGNANADKLFRLLLSRVSGNANDLRKEYTIAEIGELIPKHDSGIPNFQSYNYAITSMFGNQKGRDYFIFNDPKLKVEFTNLANNPNRNNLEWKNRYGNERVRINPVYFQD